MWIYNRTSERVRTVIMQPESNWGGQGILGCDVVQGYLHGIPPRKKAIWFQDGASPKRSAK